MLFASICSCCQRKPKESRTGGFDTAQKSHSLSSTEFRIQDRLEGVQQQTEPSVLSNETPGQTARRLQTEMAQMRKSNRDSTTECATTMKANVNNEIPHMEVHLADHNASITVMHGAYDGVEEKHNAQVNVLDLANTQRLTILEQRLDAECSDVNQRQQTAELRHSQRMDVLRFSHIAMASDARNSYAFDLEAQREDTKDTQQTQQNKLDAAKQEHHRTTDGEALCHGQEMSDMKTSSDNKTAAHDAKMVRIRDKHKHKGDDHNHMAMHLISIERKLKQREDRCASYERTLAENRKTTQVAESRLNLLIAQKEVITEVKAAMAKNCAESKTAKRSSAMKKIKRSSDAEQKRFLLNGIEKAVDADKVFGEEMGIFLGTLCDLNAQMMND